jgi:hypothetical protein
LAESKILKASGLSISLATQFIGELLAHWRLLGLRLMFVAKLTRRASFDVAQFSREVTLSRLTARRRHARCSATHMKRACLRRAVKRAIAPTFRGDCATSKRASEGER